MDFEIETLVVEQYIIDDEGLPPTLCFKNLDLAIKECKRRNKDV